MIVTIRIDAALAEAERALSEVQAECYNMEEEYTAIGRRLTAEAARPAAADFDDAQTWRDAVDDWKFDRDTATCRRREIEALHPAAAARVSECEARLKAARAKSGLAHAANAVIAAGRSGGDGATELSDFRRASTEYFNAASAIQALDSDFLAQVSPGGIRAMATAA